MIATNMAADEVRAWESMARDGSLREYINLPSNPGRGLKSTYEAELRRRVLLYRIADLEGETRDD